VRGILSAAGYVPYRRLQRAEIAAFFGTGGGRGTRSVASYDEDTTTLGRRQITTDKRLALSHNLGGYPGEMVSFVGIYGPERG
jgi:hypothetical protein